MDAAFNQLRTEGYAVHPEDEATLSPFGHEHISMLGRYSFVVLEGVTRGELSSLRNAMESSSTPHILIAGSLIASLPLIRVKSRIR